MAITDDLVQISVVRGLAKLISTSGTAIISAAPVRNASGVAFQLEKGSSSEIVGDRSWFELSDCCCSPGWL
ncbi:MAG: hypothetical protein AAF446_04195, partial [Pseudomonadota bacterium]